MSKKPKKTKRRLVVLLLTSLSIGILSPSLGQQTTFALPGSQIVNFSVTGTQSQSKTIKIPKLKSVTGISTNTGNVNYTINGENVIINTSNGAYVSREAYTDPYFYSQSASDARSSRSSSLPGSVPYNSNGYTGTLYGLGISSSYTSDGYSESTGYYEATGYYTEGGHYEKQLVSYPGHYTDKGVWSPGLDFWENVWVGGSPVWVSTGSRWVSTGSYWVDTSYYTYRQSYSGTVYKSGTNYRNYQYAYNVNINYISNDAPIISNVTVDKQIAGLNDTIKLTGTIADSDNDVVDITATLGGKTLTTKVLNGNGTWSLHYKVADLLEDDYTNITVTANDSTEITTKTFPFPKLAVDKTLPFFWAVTHTPTAPTNGAVAIQVNVGDTNTGVKQITFPDGSTTNKINALYTVAENGAYDFTVTDNSGNSYTQVVNISNIDKIEPVISAMTLQQKSNNTYDVVLKSSDASGIKKVTTNDNTPLVLDKEKGIYHISNLSNQPTHLNITDGAGNVAQDIPFLSFPILDFDKYNKNTTSRNNIIGSISGSDTITYKIGSKNYNCSNKPCDFTITKNSEITAINATSNKASIMSFDISNIDKTISNLILEGERDSANPTDIKFSWNIDVNNPIIVCEGEGEKIETPAVSNPFTYTGKNVTYTCLLTGEVGGNSSTSNPVHLFPDYSKTVDETNTSDTYETRKITKNVFTEKTTLGKTYYLNFNKNNEEDKIPIPSALLN